jgi:DNA mismatch repair protein MSH4
VVPAVRAALSSASSPLLASIRDVVCAVPALGALAVRIDQLLDDEVCSGKAAFIAVTQQVFAIRTGVDGFLDVGKAVRFRRLRVVGLTLCPVTQPARRIARRRRPFRSSALSCQPPQGWPSRSRSSSAKASRSRFRRKNTRPLLRKPGAALFRRAPEFADEASCGTELRLALQATKKGRNYVCATSELNGLNTRLMDVAKDALLLSIMVADGVVVSGVRDALPALTAFAEAVSLLDMIVNAFAAMVSGSVLPFSRPRITLDGPVAIGNGRHPVACAHMRAEGREFVPNSTFISDAASFGATHEHWRFFGGNKLSLRRSRDHRRQHGRQNHVLEAGAHCVLRVCRSASQAATACTSGGSQCCAGARRMLRCRRIRIFPAAGPHILAAGQRR